MTEFKTTYAIFDVDTDPPDPEAPPTSGNNSSPWTMIGSSAVYAMGDVTIYWFWGR